MLIIYLVDYKRYWEFCSMINVAGGLPNNLCGSMINFFVCIAGLSLRGTNIHKYIVDYQLTVDVCSLFPCHKFFIYQFECLIHFGNVFVNILCTIARKSDWLILKIHPQITMTLFTPDKRSIKFIGLIHVTGNEGEHYFVLRFWVENNLYIEI